MPPLPIPRRYRAGLAAVAALSAEDVALLTEGLDASVLEVSFDALAAPLRERVAVDVDLAQLLEAVSSLNTLLPEDGSGAESVAQDVSESEDLDIPKERRPTYATALEGLIRNPALVIAAHATEVVTEHEKVFHDARILTDIRPVFERDTSTGVKMAALTATMKLDFHPGGRSAIESVAVALDRGDLEYLSKVIERGLAKMEKLAEVMRENELPRWTPNYHHHGPA